MGLVGVQAHEAEFIANRQTELLLQAGDPVLRPRAPSKGQSHPLNLSKFG
jgi:hypothetical protein